MKTNIFAFFLAVLTSMTITPVAFSDNPPKKEQDKEQNTTSRVFTTPFAIQNEQGDLLVLREGDYSIWVFGEDGAFLYVENRHLDCYSSLPSIPGCQIVVWPISSLTNLTDIYL